MEDYKPVPETEKFKENFEKNNITVPEKSDLSPDKKKNKWNIFGKKEIPQDKIIAAKNYIQTKLPQNWQDIYNGLDETKRNNMVERFIKGEISVSNSAKYNKQTKEYEFQQGVLGGGV